MRWVSLGFRERRTGRCFLRYESTLILEKGPTGE